MALDFTSPQTLDEAVRLWHAAPGSFWLAGGTDLVPEMKATLKQPQRLVNLKDIESLRGIAETEAGVRIGALATLTEIAESDLVRTRYHALAEACRAAASPQLRNVATLGGNLNQDSRCPYYRGAFPCWLKGGQVCFMREGENREASIIGYHECVHVHPSDPPNALVALDAKIITRMNGDTRATPAMDFFRAPLEGDRRMNLLEPGEVVTEIQLPRFPNSQSTYEKAMDRAFWTFALVSAAVRVDLEGDRVSAARIVLGGVAPVPWNAQEAEEGLKGQILSPESVALASATTLVGAQPLAHNGYKVQLARALVKRSLLNLAR
ncbi:MAG: xanthine dehydrogenase family protein subunit M [Chloroflexi bacterium]|nr:xanthine dehydrogenase family protein subunit M [Chloroflexota bacterium]